ncbi:MAG TPA: formylglycine-generating enzyme family protein [Clostridiaceae bacterium]|nr:formylglycine-generating enzyme family protein [Clostridiaceae bacterium]
MKNKLKEQLKTNKGITLIALVITIIVLLILAGVTIATLTGDNGILTKAQNAKEKNAQKTVEEQINLAVQASRINEGLVIDKDILEQELTNNGIEITKSENDELPWTVKKDGYVYTISANGEVKEKEGLVITAGDIEILKGATEGKKVRAQILSGETGTIKWESTGNITLSEAGENEVTVNVNSNANAGDIATITARIDGKTYQDSINVKIVAQVTSVTAEKIEVSIGDKKKIEKITAMPENAEGIEVTSYVSQDTTKVTVDEKTGEVTGVQEGETTVTISAKGKLSGAVVTGTCSVKVTKLDHLEVVVPTITATGNLANKPNIKEVRQGNIPIPQGYNYIKGDKIGGVVITDAASGKEKEGNEFVWVPVDTLSDMAVPTSGTDANGNTNYRGVLYNWIIDATGKTVYNWSADSTSYREPANLSSSYDSTSTNPSWTSTLYQEEYNKMIKSVSQYGGFYVGRYEMSLNSETKNAESKYGATSATAESTSAKQWYGLYNKAKTYAPENASQKVVSSMIWGSQYDAMLKWMKGNNINVTSSSPTDLSIGTTSKNTTRVTGGPNDGQTVSKDKLSNIYDLLGNSYEWTQEANDTNYRVLRGGHYDYSVAPSYRDNGYPTYANSNGGSRLTLYIK